VQAGFFKSKYGEMLKEAGEGEAANEAPDSNTTASNTNLVEE